MNQVLKACISFAFVGMSVSLSGCLMTRAQLRESVAGEDRASTQGRSVEGKQERVIARDSLIYQQEYDSQFRDLRNSVDILSNRIDQVEQSASAQKSDQLVEDLGRRLGLLEEAMKSLEREMLEIKQISASKTANAEPSKQVTSKPKGAFEQGEALFAEKRWREAIMAYQKYREAQPKGSDYAEATYKIGVCFQELSMKAEAKAFYEEAVAKFPGSKQSRKAQYRLKNI